MPKVKNKLIGKRIVLKLNKPLISLANIMFMVISDNRKHLGPWFPWEAKTKNVEDSFKYLLDTHQKIKNKEKFDYGIYLDDVYIGNIGIFDISKEKKSAEIGYWLSSSYLRNGYVTEAVKLLEKEFFFIFGLNRIQIKCDERNIASAGVAKKCGYLFEGKYREDSFSDFFKGFRNTLVFSKLKSEFRRISSKKT